MGGWGWDGTGICTASGQGGSFHQLVTGGGIRGYINANEEEVVAFMGVPGRRLLYHSVIA